MANTFTDNEFGGLQCVFALFRFMLLYHDPELCNFLDQYDMGPEVRFERRVPGSIPVLTLCVLCSLLFSAI